MARARPILPVSFRVFQVLGLWMPRGDVSPWYAGFYHVRTLVTLTLIYSFAVTGTVGLILAHEDIQDLTNNCFVLLSIVVITAKTVNVIGSRKAIIEMLETLEDAPCLPENQEEAQLQASVDRAVWLNTMVYGVMTEVTVLMLTLGTFFQGIPVGTLPFSAWIPWNYSSGLVYWLTYLSQISGVILSANVDIGYDTMVPGMMMQVSAKLEILKHRFSHLAEVLEVRERLGRSGPVDKSKVEKELIVDYVKYHLVIFKLAESINSTFRLVIFFQWCTSTVVLCVSVYILANIEIFSTEFTSIALYLCCMLMEIFVFCAAGNEATRVSRTVGDAIYAMDWTGLKSSSVKSLIIVMSRTLRPVEFSSGRLVTLSYDSFKSLIKISYSTFNVLQRTS